MNKGLRVLSLFDGISCGQVALERAGIPVEVYYASEIDKYAIEITQKNYPNTIQLGSVTDIDFTEFIGKVDLIIGGSPCQDLSIAGKRKGLSGERSGLFYKFVEAIEVIKPKYFLLENNVGMPQDAYEEISRLMGGYPVMINSALVSAQTRKRYYWTNIGLQELNLFGFPTCKIPQPEDKGILLKDVLEKNTLAPDEKSRAIIGSIGRTTDREYFKKNQGQLVAEPIKIPENTVKGYSDINQYIKPCALRNRGEGKQPEFNGNDKANALTSVQTDSMVLEPIRIGHFNKGEQGQRIYSSNAKSIACASGEGGGTQIWTEIPLEPLQLGHIGNTNAQANRVYSVRNKSVTLKANGGGGGAKTGLYKIDLPDGEYLIRKLTPLECERLQTLPDNYTEGISNTQRYKCIGNGWTVDVIAHIFSFIELERYL